MTRVAGAATLMRLLTAAGLGVDAGIHADLAASQPPNGDINQIDLFYFEAALASLAALLVLVSAARLAYAFAFLVAASALGVVVLYRYVDVGPLGPLPDMHEPVWYTEKTISLVGEGIAAVAAAVGILTVRRRPEDGDPLFEREHVRNL